MLWIFVFQDILQEQISAYFPIFVKITKMNSRESKFSQKLDPAKTSAFKVCLIGPY